MGIGGPRDGGFGGHGKHDRHPGGPDDRGGMNGKSGSGDDERGDDTAPSTNATPAAASSSVSA
jgi:hypothetical protein